MSRSSPIAPQLASPFVAYRIGSSAYPLLDGAAASGQARWSSKGRFVIYASEHYATALLERAAQMNSVRVPRSLVFARIDIPQGATVEEVDEDGVSGWDTDDRIASQAFGDQWYDERRSLLLLVPSLVAPEIERNVLINQRHPQFGRIAISSAERLRCHPGLLL